MGRKSLRVLARPSRVMQTKTPRRSSTHSVRSTRLSASSRATSRDIALWLRCTVSAERLDPQLAAAGLGEALEDLELARC